MTPLTLPVEDWDSLTSLCFDRKVLQLGVADGQDTAQLARSAHVVVAMGRTPDHSVDDTVAVMAGIMRATVDNRTARNVLVHQETWREALGTYSIDQFDLAVVNPEALGGGVVDDYLVGVGPFADHVVLIEAANTNSWAAMRRLFPQPGWSLTRSGRLLLARDLGMAGYADLVGR